MKKILTLVLSLVMALSASLGVSASIVERQLIGPFVKDETFILGDADKSGEVNALDAYAVKAYIVDIESDISNDAADITADGKVSTKDLFYLKLCFAELKKLSDFENGYSTYNFTIADNPISDYEIVLNSDFVLNADCATAATGLLKGYVKNACGYELSDTTENERTKPHMIRMVRMDPDGEEAAKMGLGYEDYIYEVKDGDLYIYGTLRGNMYAVYEIAEKYFEYRFTDPSFSYLYKHRTVNIPEDTFAEKHVKIKYRYSGQGTSTDTLYSNYLPNRLNSTCISGGNDAKAGYQYGPVFDNAHTFLSLNQLGTGYDAMKEEGYDDEYIKKNLWTAFSKGETHEYTWEPCGSNFKENSAYAKIVHGMFLVFDMYSNMGYDMENLIKYNQIVSSVSHGDNINGCNCRTCTAIMNGKKISCNETLKTTLAEKYSGEYTLEDNRVQFNAEGFAGLYLNFTNQAARELKEVYPTVKVFTINYDHAVPATVRPDENVIIFYCGHGCIQHSLGTGGCGDNLTALGGSNKQDEQTLKAWADMCHEKGSEIWYWSYATNYTFNFLHTPNIKEMYDNWKYLIDYCGFDGIYFEGQSSALNFEKLKSYLSNNLIWNTDMTYEEYLDLIKEYLYMYYGSSEELFEYLMMLQDAGDATGYCFITNYSRPFDMYSWQYLSEHYEEMRTLLLTALDKAKDEDQMERVEFLLCSCDFMGLSSSYSEMYTNGDAESRKLYEERYTAFFNYITEHNIKGSEEYGNPEEIDFSENPVYQFYIVPAWESELCPPQ